MHNKNETQIAVPANVFRFVSCGYDAEIATATLKYAIDDMVFTEKLVFQGAPRNLSGEQSTAIDHCLHYLHIAAGVSYYKTSVPRRITVETRPLSQTAAAFFDDFYVNGLGEFAYQNKLDLQDHIHFPYEDDWAPQAQSHILPRKTAVPVGGGKDSSVTLDLVKQMNENVTALSVGHHRAIDAIATTADVPLIHIKRHLSPNLFQLNKAGALNGHVPITGILSFIFVIAGIIYGFDTVVMSNERSANTGNLEIDGFKVNHQWSKSDEFEITFRKLLTDEMLPGFDYFSLLRPFSELSIAKLFSKRTRFHPHFSSCNKAFKIEGSIQRKWCTNCDKCRFVFLILAPFLNPKAMVEIFGVNLFEQDKQLSGFKKLLGLGDQKPFECVGEFEESIAALTLLGRHPQWCDNNMLKNLLGKINISPSQADGYIKKAFTTTDVPWIPKRYKEVLHAATGSKR